MNVDAPPPLDDTRKAFLVLLDLAECHGWPEGESDLMRGSVESVARHAMQAPEGAAVVRAAGLEFRANPPSMGYLNKSYLYDWPGEGWLVWAHGEIARRFALLSATETP